MKLQGPTMLSLYFAAFVSIEGEHDRAMQQKFFYLLGNLSLVALALYKCHSMGLLPTATSDWLAFMEHKAVRTLYIFLSFKFLRGYVHTVPDSFLTTLYVHTALLNMFSLFTQNNEQLGI